MATELLLYTKPIPVLSYKSNKKWSDFRGPAAFGVCASRNLKYFGFKLVALTTLDGIPIVYELVPANTDERIAAEEVLDFVWGCDIFGDKGFLGDASQLDQANQRGNRIWAAKRANQAQQNSPELDHWLNSIRERIEGVFNEIQNVDRNVERLLAKTVVGLCTRIIAKMANHTLKGVLRRFSNIDIISFSYSVSQKLSLPRLQLIWADGGYRGKLVDWVQETFSWVLEIVKRNDDVKGFEVIPRRRVVERTFGWLNNYRRLSKDYEELPQTSEAMIYATMTHIMVRRLAGTPTFRR